ncbi:hypothetical protein ACVWZW_000541 [Bradyrhizobium sp. F1.13.4]
MKQRHAEQHVGARLRLQQQIERPGLIDLVGMRVPHQLWRAGGATGVEIGGDVVAQNLAPADKAVRRLLLDQVAEGKDSLPRVTATEHLYDRLEMLELRLDLLDFLPDVCARHRPERHQDFCVRRFQNLRDLVRLQERIDGIGDAGGLCAEQRYKGVRHQRQHEADDVALLDTKRVKHVGGLRDARDEVAVRDHDRRVGRIGVLQELERRPVGVTGRTQPDGVVSALGRDAIGVRDLLEGSNLRVRCQLRIVVADEPIERMDARHGIPFSLRCMSPRPVF